MTFLYNEVRTFCKANEVFVKYRRVKKIYIRIGDAFSIEDAFGLIEQKEVDKQQSDRRPSEGGMLEVKPTTLQYYRQCGKNGYNI